MSVVSRVRVESPTLSHESESSQPGKFESSTTLMTVHMESKQFSNALIIIIKTVLCRSYIG